MSDKELITDVDALLDGTLDDLADMPEFKPFPVGTHKIKPHLESKKINGFSAIEFKVTAIETIELPSGSQDAPLAAGDSTNILYFLTHKNPKTMELGQGQFKELMKVCATAFGPDTNRNLIAKLNEMDEVVVVMGQRTQKDTGRVFNSIEMLHIT